MKRAAAIITKNFINFIYPLHCASCKKPLEPVNSLGVCELCLKGIKRNPRPYTGRFYSACLYEGSLKELIHQFKYKGRENLKKALSVLIAGFIRDNREILNGIDKISFVPLKNSRLAGREFNQSELLAMEISKEFGIPVCGTLEKIKKTRRQNELSREDRLVNLNGAFRVKDASEVNGLGMLLVDDVMTTGATLKECSRVLIEAGAKEVRCLTLARGVLDI